MVKNGSNWSNLAAGDEAAVLEAGDGRHDQAQQAALLLLLQVLLLLLLLLLLL